MEKEIDRTCKNVALQPISAVESNDYTGLFKKKYTLSKMYFTKTVDAKSMSCVRMERKSLKVLILMI
jgi:hypothetical protein